MIAMPNGEGGYMKERVKLRDSRSPSINDSELAYLTL